jgi:uncharacterized protein YjiS (DUF1127 family)
MSDRTFTIHAPLSPWTRRLARSTSGVAGSAAVEPRWARFDLPDAGCAPSTGGPRRPGLWASLRAAWRRHQTRRCLADLDAAALKDIGISYAEAEAEANKPFWVL